MARIGIPNSKNKIGTLTNISSIRTKLKTTEIVLNIELRARIRDWIK